MFKGVKNNQAGISIQNIVLYGHKHINILHNIEIKIDSNTIGRS
jgi:hypothetical protein